MAEGFNGTDLIPTRRSLLTRLKDWGDQAGWQEFFDIYWRLIYSIAMHDVYHAGQIQTIKALFKGRFA